MGRMAVAILLEAPAITSITIADKDFELAQAFVNLLNSRKLKAIQIDVTEKQKLVELMQEHDIIINTVGPYYRFGKMIIESAIEAKKPYFDICDDWKPIIEILKMSNKAKEAGITAIVGIGASPGVSNLLAVLACNELDEIDNLITAWGLSLTEKSGKKPKYYIKKRKLMRKVKRKQPKANAAIEHLLHESIGKIPIIKEEKLIEIEALTESEPIDFPGYRKMYACYIGHPEPITLNRTLKARNICNLMFIGKKPTDLTRKYAEKVENKELSIKEAIIQLNKKFNRLILISVIFIWKLIREYSNGPPTICAIATGIKEGKKKKIGVGIYNLPYGYMAGITGVPLAIAVLMMIDGKITKKGILTPEEAIEPIEFFNRLAKYCGRNLKGKDILIMREENLDD